MTMKTFVSKLKFLSANLENFNCETFATQLASSLPLPLPPPLLYPFCCASAGN